MKEVLKAVCLFVVDVIKPIEPEFTDTPMQIATDPRFMPHFKVIMYVHIIYIWNVIVFFF